MRGERRVLRPCKREGNGVIACVGYDVIKKWTEGRNEGKGRRGKLVFVVVGIGKERAKVVLEEERR